MADISSGSMPVSAGSVRQIDTISNLAAPKPLRFQRHIRKQAGFFSGASCSHMRRTQCSTRISTRRCVAEAQILAYLAPSLVSDPSIFFTLADCTASNGRRCPHCHVRQSRVKWNQRGECTGRVRNATKHLTATTRGHCHVWRAANNINTLSQASGARFVRHEGVIKWVTVERNQLLKISVIIYDNDTPDV